MSEASKSGKWKVVEALFNSPILILALGAILIVLGVYGIMHWWFSDHWGVLLVVIGFTFIWIGVLLDSANKKTNSYVPESIVAKVRVIFWVPGFLFTGE